jgi:hypothetical protein
MNKKLLAIVAIGLTVTLAPIVGVASPWENRASATNNANAILDPTSPPLTINQPTSTAVPNNINNASLWQGIQGSSVGNMTGQITSFLQSGATQVQTAVNSAVQGAVQSAINAGSNLLGFGGGFGGGSGIDLSSILRAAQGQTNTLAKKGIDDAVAKMSSSSNPNAVAAAAEVLATASPSSISDAVAYASGVELAASTAGGTNPVLGTPLSLSAVNAQGGSFIANAAIGAGAVAKTTGDVAVNTANAQATKDKAQSVSGTNAADSSLDELNNIKKVLEVHASINSDGVIATSKLVEGTMNSTLVQGAALSLASSEADRQIQKQREEESQIIAMKYRANYSKALLTNISSGGATNTSTSNLTN